MEDHWRLTTQLIVSAYGSCALLQAGTVLREIDCWNGESTLRVMTGRHRGLRVNYKHVAASATFRRASPLELLAACEDIDG